MKALSKCLFVATAAIFPAVASASVETLSFSCSSNLVVSLEKGYQASCDGDFSFDSGTLIDDTSISIGAKGQLIIGEQVRLTAPDIRLFANNATVYGSLSALDGIIEINSSKSVELGRSAKLDGKNITLSAVYNTADSYEAKTYLPSAGNTMLSKGAVITNGSFNSDIGLLSGMQGGVIKLEAPIFIGVYGDRPAIPLSAVSQVPEPSNLSMLALGLLGVSFVARRKASH